MHNSQSRAAYLLALLAHVLQNVSVLLIVGQLIQRYCLLSTHKIFGVRRFYIIFRRDGGPEATWEDCSNSHLYDQHAPSMTHMQKITQHQDQKLVSAKCYFYEREVAHPKEYVTLHCNQQALASRGTLCKPVALKHAIKTHSRWAWVKTCNMPAVRGCV